MKHHNVCMQKSPFNEGADPFHTPNVTDSGVRTGAHPGVSAYAGGRLCIFERLIIRFGKIE